MPNLNTLYAAVAADPGLDGITTPAQYSSGLTFVGRMNALLLQVIDQTNVNDDGVINYADMQTISNAVRSNPTILQTYQNLHGNSNGPTETGFHQIQGQAQGGNLLFQGHEFVHKVVEGIYNFGSVIVDGYYVNPIEGHPESVAKAAGWLNYFLNGVNIVLGTNKGELLDSGGYSDYFAAARNERFLAGGGNDMIWAGDGNDVIYAGTGDDTSGAGTGNDRMFGEGGNDIFYGEDGNDLLDGGEGNDSMGAGAGNDQLRGGAGNDSLFGDGGNDILQGQAGRDTIYASDGADYIDGGQGADLIYLWENVRARDVLVFRAPDSGRTTGTYDVVEGFVSGVDDIDLRPLGPMTFASGRFLGGGQNSAYYDGQFLRIDHTGDGAADMVVEFRYLQSLSASDFLLG